MSFSLENKFLPAAKQVYMLAVSRFGTTSGLFEKQWKPAVETLVSCAKCDYMCHV